MEIASSSYYFKTRDLVTIGVLSALGGALSTYIGYLGQLLNAALGTPFGAGQFLSGLHVFWIILTAGIVRRPGTSTLTGLLKGVVEFFSGSTHGLVVVLVSLVQGFIVDIGLSATHHKDSLSLYAIIGGLATASNVLVFQLLFFSGAPFLFILLLIILAFCSGIIFAGYFGNATLALLLSTNFIRTPFPSENSISLSSKSSKISPYKISAVIFLSVLAVGASLYAVFVWRPVIDPFGCEVKGLVMRPYFFSYGSFASDEVTIEAELIGSVTHIPLQNYTGVPLHVIIEFANPMNSATTLQVIASDGYSAIFTLNSIQNDNGLILTIDGGLRLVAAGYPGEYWVEKVVSLVIS
jgi:energy-coupling factor transport system substrate-specific component